MKYLVWILSILFITSANSQSSSVYICTGPSAEKYHFTSNCRGLSNCSRDIIRVSISEAKSKGRSICGWED